MNDKAAGYLSSCVQRRSEMNSFVWPAVIKMKAGLGGHYGESADFLLRRLLGGFLTK